jgi:glycolate oxidase FAD binding subunit
VELTDVAQKVAAPLEARRPVVVVGAGTHREVGNPVAADAEAIEVPSGIVTHEPADLTVRLWAGTPFRELHDALAATGQEVALDPRDAHATVGGVLACGLSGLRRLRLGPVRDTVLEVRAIDGRGTLFKGGGPTVKNVTGYDIPRLLVGSLGTLAVIVQVVLRCRAIASTHAWFRAEGLADADDVQTLRGALFRPSCVLWDGTAAAVLLEGAAEDVANEAAAAGLGAPRDHPPLLPGGEHRGRISIAPARVGDLADRLRAHERLRFAAEIGVGTVHVACDDANTLLDARDAAHAEDGWLLRERGGDGCDGFGVELPNVELLRRVKAAFDPDGLLAPGRMPL